MIETFRAEQWLYGLFNADTGVGGVRTLTGGRIYAYVAPSTATYPVVVLNHQAGHDVRGTGPYRIMASMLYQVKVIGAGKSAGFGALKTIADRIDTLLQGVTGSVVDGSVLSCVREQPLAYTEVEEGIVYSHLGGLYRLQVQ